MNAKSIAYFSAVGFGVLFLWLFVWPKLQEIEDVRGQAAEEQNRRIVLQETRDNIEDAYSFFVSLSQEEKDLMALAVPADPERIDLVNLLHKMVADNGLIVNAVNVESPKSAGTKGAPVAADTASSVSITINAAGSYDSFKQLLTAIESSLRIMDVKTLSIEEGGESDIYNFSITGEAYYAPSDDSSSSAVGSLSNI